LNYSILKRELLVALRGTRYTQIQLSQNLGFTYNQVGKWENDTKKIKWEDFYLICELLKIPLEVPMKEVFLSMETSVSSTKSAFAVLKNFHSHLSKNELAQTLGCHVSGLKRWLSGQVRPDLEVILAMMDLRPHLLSTFISKVANVENIPSLSSRYQQEVSRRKSESRDPLLTVVELCLGLEAYKNLAKHSDIFIANKTGLTPEQASASLKKLLVQNRIQWVNGKYVNNFTLINTHGDPQSIAQMRSFWTKQALKRFNTASGIPDNFQNRPNFQSCFVASISSQGMKKISERLHLCFEEIYQIINEDKSPDEEIRIILMDSFSPDDVPSGEPSSERGLK
jgi:transcriptional regulator with XRE-family HTH domain